MKNTPKKPFYFCKYSARFCKIPFQQNYDKLFIFQEIPAKISKKNKSMNLHILRGGVIISYYAELHK